MSSNDLPRLRRGGPSRRSVKIARSCLIGESGDGRSRSIVSARACRASATVTVSDDPAAQAHPLVERFFALFHDCRAVVRQLRTGTATTGIREHGGRAIALLRVGRRHRGRLGTRPRTSCEELLIAARRGPAQWTSQRIPRDAPASTTRYYLSIDPAKGAGDILLTGSRAVGALAPSGASKGAATVTVRHDGSGDV